MTFPNSATDNLASVFHDGEKTIQERVGVRDKVEVMGRRVVRDYMPGQHREFFSSLPYAFAGSIDEMGWPQASILIGPEGFISSPDENIFSLSGDYQSFPRLGSLESGSEFGLLGIEFHSRRRNRVNGILTEKSGQDMHFQVKQSFGACPKYIQKRDYTSTAPKGTSHMPNPLVSDRLDGSIRKMVKTADSFFIASQYNGDNNKSAHGVDVSNRGGKPGFVHLENDQTLIWPDYVGNFMFNTLGNLQGNPKAGLLFIDFTTGDILNIRGEAEVVWDTDLIDQFEGAQRFVRFHILETRLLQNVIPARWTFREYSPALEGTGSWDQVSPAARDGLRELRLERIVQESAVISSFYFKAIDGQPLPPYQPGQFLPLKVEIPGQDKALRRTYTLSDTSGGDYYRLSIKREAGNGSDVPPGVVSCYFHDQLKVGDVIRAAEPAGIFTLKDSERPLVLLSGGVGITPMIAMLNNMIARGQTRPVYFIHGALNAQTHAFSDHIHQLADKHDHITAHIRYSHPTPEDALGKTHDSVGYVDITLIKSLLPFDDYDFYLCGPGPFMDSLTTALRAMNIADERIHSESFGPATGLKPVKAKDQPVTKKPAKPAKVSFERSKHSATWQPGDGSLLEFAEAQGLSPDNSCRAGSCGSCMTKIISGKVNYETEPLIETPLNHALLCCAVPKGEEELRLDI